jgi:hypothetical protein
MLAAFLATFLPPCCTTVIRRRACFSDDAARLAMLDSLISQVARSEKHT